ncbi:MAG: hypothetical protein IPH49_05070 [Ignavibacteria bacterium]|nr:hypothetical protein [Ignavibacteria bacterium]
MGQLQTLSALQPAKSVRHWNKADTLAAIPAIGSPLLPLKGTSKEDSICLRKTLRYGQ